MTVRRIQAAALVVATALAATAAAAAVAGPKRVTVTGELIDTWCYVTEIMYGLGTAHHQCALWCAIGGIPVSIRDDDDNVKARLTPVPSRISRTMSSPDKSRACQLSQSVFTLRQARLTASLPTLPPNRPASARRTRRVLVPARYVLAIIASARLVSRL